MAASVTALSTLIRHSRHYPTPPILTSASTARKIILLRINRVNLLPVTAQYRQHCSTKMSAETSEKITAPYGSWKSPITSELVSGSDKRLGGTAVDSLGHLFWLESRPTESGRLVIVKEGEKAGDEPIDITPKEFSVRTLAQEYGGGAFSISGAIIIFSNYKDQRLYKQSISSKDSAPIPVTPDYGKPLVCYADGVFDSCFNRYVTVREDCRQSSANSITTIVSVNPNDKNIQEPKVLVSGRDFYAFPRIDPKGERIAWIEWGHPNMPWDRSELWVGYIGENGDVQKRICVAGGDKTVVESPTEPKWSPEGELFFITDRKTGFWNLYKWVESTNEVLPVYPLDAEFSRPLWIFGINSYEFIQDKNQRSLIACSYRKDGRSYLGILDTVQSTLSTLDIPFTDINNITSWTQSLYVEGASAVHPLSIAKVSVDFQKSEVSAIEIAWSSASISSDVKSYFSMPELIKFSTEVPGETAYAYFYPPANPFYQASPEERPPLLLKSHGGPTAESRATLSLNSQYWTSRGWAFVDVNYGGSTGYGREYRERLYGKWGIVDVNDCCSCAKYLVDREKVDGERLCITGGSAGGYTTLAALAFRETFKAGASLYGVGDLKLLKEETHKFESHYIDNLVGSEEAYFERSPIHFVEKFSCPIILFQGLEDKDLKNEKESAFLARMIPLIDDIGRLPTLLQKWVEVYGRCVISNDGTVVPPDQARKIYYALKEKGLPVALVEYEGEQHGFRKAENIKFTLEQQMVFFARLVGHFEVPDEITPVKIENFD